MSGDSRGEKGVVSGRVKRGSKPNALIMCDNKRGSEENWMKKDYIDKGGT